MENKILVEIDKSSSMASISLNSKCIMEGNFWDFHNDCHGIYDWGNFTSYYDLYSNIKSILLKKGEKVNLEIKDYKYE